MKKNEEIDWFINCAPSALGERSIMGALITKIHTGPNSGPVSTDLYSDAQVGFSPRGRYEGTIGRARRLTRMWRKLTPKHQAALIAHYTRSIEHLPPNERAELERKHGDLAGVVYWCVELEPRSAAEDTEAALQLINEAHKMWKNNNP